MRHRESIICTPWQLILYEFSTDFLQPFLYARVSWPEHVASVEKNENIITFVSSSKNRTKKKALLAKLDRAIPPGIICTAAMM